VKRATVSTATVSCVSAAGRFAPAIVNTEQHKLMKAKNVGHRQDFYLFNSESSYVSKEYSFTNYNPLLGAKSFVFQLAIQKVKDQDI